MQRPCRFTLQLLSLCILLATAHAQWAPLNPVTAFRQVPDGVLFTMQVGTLKVQVCTDSIIRVRYSVTSEFSSRPDYVVTKSNWPESKWQIQSTSDAVTLTTSRVAVTVARKDGAITYHDLDGKQLVQEASRKLTPEKVNGEDTYRAESFISIYGSHEALYGLGQHQAGVWNYRGESVDISQDNSNISVPLLLSSNGYGIFWNNDSRSRFNNRFANYLYISSEVADNIDYYFFYGSDFDRIIAAYRELTGQAPMFGKWAYGFWQCKNRYKSQEEILGIAAKYRELHIPADNIVQDWFWWNIMGEPVFNKNYPDPKGMIDDLHKNNFHVMFSFWPYFRPGSPVYDEMDKRGYFVDKTKVSGFHPAGQALYDAFQPGAREYYWKLMDGGLFQIGADAWWLDTDEPETEGRETNILVTNKAGPGSGARFANLYPLMTTSAVYEGQRKTSEQKRVFILSRSAFAGAQRNSIAAWSGDVESNWLSFARQIPAGLNFELSGIPYWTTDIGGFIIGNPDDPAYRELFVRWFEYGTFCPIFRLHGTRTTNQNELWSYGPEAQTILTSYDRLRYRLMPYIYSLAWKTTSEAYTPMRALAMDFRSDPRALNIGDQFMFGPALLVNPVTEPSATSRRMYLPKVKWYDFWTGQTANGGGMIETAAPLERIPLFVRAGSLVPLGPDVEYATEKPADPIELRVYPGANASFTLYEDENDNYNYEKGARATIRLDWDDATRRLTIGERQGKFPGMLGTRTFRVVFASANHGVGIGPTGQVDKTVEYSGRAITFSL
jgi:alpha-D-xyloside xylohydrolase